MRKHLVAWTVNARTLHFACRLCIVEGPGSKLVHHGLANSGWAMNRQDQGLYWVGVVDVVADSITELPEGQALAHHPSFEKGLEPLTGPWRKGLWSCRHPSVTSPTKARLQV